MKLRAMPLTAKDFATFGDVIEVSGTPDVMINQGKCGRFHDLAQLDFADGNAGISLFDAEARHLPYHVEMMERHPEGSQAFIPMNGVPMLVVVATDNAGQPIDLKAFISGSTQGINLHRGVWHGVLAPLDAPGKFAVLDRIGAGPNLEEHWFEVPYIVEDGV